MDFAENGTHVSQIQAIKTIRRPAWMRNGKVAESVLQSRLRKEEAQLDVSYQKLARAVLLRAAKDLHSSDAKLRKEAEQFLMCDNEDLRFWRFVAGM